jgi:hypothetical protein
MITALAHPAYSMEKLFPKVPPPNYILVEIISGTMKNFRWGNFCGSDYPSVTYSTFRLITPRDEIDEKCKQHDDSYFRIEQLPESARTIDTLLVDTKLQGAMYELLKIDKIWYYEPPPSATIRQPKNIHQKLMQPIDKLHRGVAFAIAMLMGFKSGVLVIHEHSAELFQAGIKTLPEAFRSFLQEQIKEFRSKYEGEFQATFGPQWHAMKDKVIIIPSELAYPMSLGALASNLDGYSFDNMDHFLGILKKLDMLPNLSQCSFAIDAQGNQIVTVKTMEYPSPDKSITKQLVGYFEDFMKFSRAMRGLLVPEILARPNLEAHRAGSAEIVEILSNELGQILDMNERTSLAQRLQAVQ